MNNNTATQSHPERIVMLSEQTLLTLAGLFHKSNDPDVKAAAKYLYREVKKSGKIKP